MPPYIDELSPPKSAPGYWITIKGSGFRPQAPFHIRRVRFRSVVDGSSVYAEFTHIAGPVTGGISDSQLRARVPPLLAGAPKWTLKRLRSLSPAGAGSPSRVARPRRRLPYHSNAASFLILCRSPMEQLAEATMPPEAREGIEAGVIALQNDLSGGSFTFMLPDKSSSGTVAAYRANHLQGTVTIEDVTSAWQSEVWSISLTAALRVRGDLDLRGPRPRSSGRATAAPRCRVAATGGSSA